MGARLTVRAKPQNSNLLHPKPKISRLKFSAMRRFSRIFLVCAVLGAPIFLFSQTRAGNSLLSKLETSLQAQFSGDSREATWLLPVERRVAIENPLAAKIVEAAHAQKGDVYDASYRKISFPNGDVPPGRGACTDVVIRALRAVGVDLQSEIHRDMRARFAAYPDSWGLGRTDKNIDHRRVPNHLIFLRKYGQKLPNGIAGADLKTWLPGDIVYWKMDGGKWHTGVVSDGISTRGMPMVIHNGWRCVEQDYLDRWEIVGHFRYPKRGA